jgi:copper homeostasis protein
MLLEIAVFNIESAIAAERAGAHRLELCENAGEGGTTPSYGTLKLVKQKVSIPVFPIIRPRGGDFLYTDIEFEVMKQDVQLCKQLGFEGVVIGLLNADGTVDTKRTKQLTDLAYPLKVTFHRAFDRTAEPFEAMEQLIAIGCQRILTSGQVPDANNGKDLIKQLIEKAADRIIIMPGSGVRANNIKQLAEYTGAIEMHSSARTLSDSLMSLNKISMNENLKAVSVDAEEIKKMLNHRDTTTQSNTV